MKKNVIKVTFVAVVGLLAGINVFNAQNPVVLSDIAMANVEALTQPETIYGKVQPKTVVCDLQEGPWHTGAVERKCISSEKEGSCIPMPCGGFN